MNNSLNYRADRVTEALFLRDSVSYFILYSGGVVMFTEEAIIKILGKVTLAVPEINQNKLREILEEVLYDYEIQEKSKALVVQNDFEDKIMIYLASKRLDGLSAKTLSSYQLHLIRFAYFIRKNVADITTMDLRVFLAYLAKNNNLKATSLETEKSILKSFFNWLEGEDYILKSPARKLKPTKIEKRLRKSLTSEELEMLRDSCKTPRQRALLEFIFSTGCRLSEVVGVNINDINWNDCSLKVIGKGNKERMVFFSQKAKLYLKKYIQSRDINISQALFIASRKPFKRIGNRAVQREIHKIAEQAGFEKPVFPHLLRHTMATLALQSGASLTTVQTLLGHEDPATTEIYAEISNDVVREEYRKHLIQ